MSELRKAFRAGVDWAWGEHRATRSTQADVEALRRYPDTPPEAKAESGENEAFKSSLEAFLSKWKDAGRDTVILMEGFSKGWLAHRDACPTPSAIPEVSRIAFEAGADWKMLREGFVQGLDSHDRKIAKAEAIRRYPDANPSGENSGDKK